MQFTHDMFIPHSLIIDIIIVHHMRNTSGSNPGPNHTAIETLHVVPTSVTHQWKDLEQFPLAVNHYPTKIFSLCHAILSKLEFINHVFRCVCVGEKGSVS